MGDGQVMLGLILGLRRDEQLWGLCVFQITLLFGSLMWVVFCGREKGQCEQSCTGEAWGYYRGA